MAAFWFSGAGHQLGVELDARHGQPFLVRAVPFKDHLLTPMGAFSVFEPEVPGGLGPNTLMDMSVLQRATPDAA
jgi:hypothetical protein